uniref:Uncharacterized protein n=1 Tax=Anguilla anguilla TaxID=7936 RepID=A0A0E9S8Z8_ANGAN
MQVFGRECNSLFT